MPESRNIPWTPEDISVCLIGYHGALFDIASVLAEANIEVGAVVSHIDDADGKKGPEAVLAENGLFRNLREMAEKAKAPFLHLPDPNAPESINQIRDKGVNLVLSVSAPVLSSAFLDAFDGWAFNFHGSRRYRGRAGLTWVILHEFLDDAVVLHWMDRGIDTGDFVAESSFSWTQDDYPLDLFKIQRPCYADLAGKFLDLLAGGAIPKVPQDPSRPYFPSLYTDEDGWIDWNWTPEDAERVVRGFGRPYAGASTLLENASRGDQTLVRIGRSRVPEGPPPKIHPIANGSILDRKKDGGIDVACGTRVLHIETFRQGDNEIPAANIAGVGMRLRNKQ